MPLAINQIIVSLVLADEKIILGSNEESPWTGLYSREHLSNIFSVILICTVWHSSLSCKSNAKSLVVGCSRHFTGLKLSLIHISEPTRLLSISYAVFCLK